MLQSWTWAAAAAAHSAEANTIMKSLRKLDLACATDTVTFATALYNDSEKNLLQFWPSFVRSWVI